MSMRLSHFATLAFILLVALPGLAQAQATRTWVSGVGDDANPCSRTAPCKTFAGAISKTATGGEISVLDPGGFGAVTITKSISIVAEGQEGGVLAASTNGIIVNGANVRVYLKNLYIEGATTGLNGIRILNAAHVTIEDCTIRGFVGLATSAGIDVQSTGSVLVSVRNTQVTDNSVGINVKPPVGPFAKVFVEKSSIQGNTTGIVSDGNQSEILLHDNVVTINQTGLSMLNGGFITSFGTNAVFRNMAVDGSPNNGVTLK